eukprot:40849-Eustigmatos_ZCMA.PRE.1
MASASAMLLKYCSDSNTLPQGFNLSCRLVSKGSCQQFQILTSFNASIMGKWQAGTHRVQQELARDQQGAHQLNPP